MKLTGNQEVVQLLQRCCKAGTPAMVVSNRLAVIAQGRFVELRDDALVLQIIADPGLGGTPELETCSVSFCYAAIPYIFMVRLRELRPVSEPAPEGALWSTFERPDEISLIERRKTFRVPVGEGAGLTVSLRVGRRRWEAVPHNISLHGMLIEVQSTGDDGALQEGRRFALQLALEGQQLALDATIYRRRGRYCAVAFPEVRRPGGGSVRSEMRDLVEGLKERWLRGEAPAPPPVVTAPPADALACATAAAEEAEPERPLTPESSALQGALLAAIEQCAFSVELLDVQGRLLHANAAFESFTGLPRERALGREINAELAADAAQVERVAGALAAAGSGQQWSGEVQTRGGAHQLSVMPVRDREGRVTHLLVLRR